MKRLIAAMCVVAFVIVVLVLALDLHDGGPTTCTTKQGHTFTQQAYKSLTPGQRAALC